MVGCCALGLPLMSVVTACSGTAVSRLPPAAGSRITSERNATLSATPPVSPLSSCHPSGVAMSALL